MEKYKHRIFGVCVLFLMAALTIGTTVSFAGNERSGSYTLTIQKVFDENLTGDALKEAEKLTYTFRVAAQVKSGGEYVPVEEIVKITGAHEKTIEFDNAFKISVIEQTDPGGFKIDGKEWNVTNTLCQSTMHVGASQATLNISRDNGKISVTRPNDSPTVTFQLTGESFHHGSGLAPGTGEPPSEDDDKKPDDQDPEAKPNENSGEGEKSATPETGEGQGDQSDNSNEAGGTEGQQAVEPDKPDEPDKSNEPETADPQGEPGTEPTEPDEAIVPQSQQGDETGEGNETEEMPEEPKAEGPKDETPEEPKAESPEIPPLPVQPNVVKTILPRSEDDHGNENDFTFGPKTETVAPGETKELGTNLQRGKYTITKLRAADGFSVLVGEREFDVAAGGTGTVHINGSDSKITITAPPVAADGVVRTHHYRVYKDGRQVRDIDVLSGDTGTVEHLDAGEYTIKVYETYSGVKGYTVKYPNTTMKPLTGNVTTFTKGSSRSWKTFDVHGAGQVEFYGYGPLYDKSDNPIKSNVTYQPNWGVLNNEGKVVPNLGSKSSRAGNKTYTLNKPKKLIPIKNLLCVAISEVSDDNVKSIDVHWREYKETVKSATVTNANTLANGKVVTVNGLNDNYITISKAADDNERGQEVKYYYTIKDSNGKLITDFTVTDEKGNDISVPTNEEFDGVETTVTLKAGQTVKINGLKAGGNYKIFESVEEAPAMGFGIKLEDTKKSVTTPKGSIEITTLGERVVKISRPGDPADDNHRVYTYNIYKKGQADVFRAIKLKAGETTTVMEATGSMLPPGSYRIEAMDDEIVGFDVTYTDSSSITSDFVRSATVTFTNHFAEVQASYHVIHEYYLKDGDSYEFEGASPVFTKNCERDHDEGDGHYAKDVHQMEVYNGNTYTHIAEGGDAYGKVVSWPKGTNAIEVQLDEGTDIPYTTGPFVKEGTGSNGTGSKDDPGTRDYAYVPLTNLTFATATKHDNETGIHAGDAQIIILRYYREAKPIERGKYNVIHVYYQRTDKGDVWEGSSELETIDIGSLTDENRYKTYDADGVEKKLHFTPKGKERQYPYVYDGAAYGRIVDSDKTDDYNGEGTAGDGKGYRKDDVMTSVKATSEGDQIIILRYYRSGGYRIVHEYYYREKMEGAEDSGSVEETPGGGEETPEEMEPMLLALGDDQPTEDSGFNGTLTNSGGYAYDFEGSSAIDALTADLESRHDADDVTKITQFRPDGEEEQTYQYIDAVYGYCDKETGLYRVAPYMTGVTATDQEDEIIILRYCRGDVDQPETPPDKPDKPSGGGGTPTPPKDPEIPAIPEKPTEPESPTEPENPGGPDDPKPPTDPSRPTTLPDPNQPGSPNQVTIWENGVPTTYVKLWDPEKEKWVYIPETEVPTTGKGTPTTTTIPRISRVPKTGDGGGPWGALIAAALSGFGALRLPFWKKKDE